MSDPSTYAGLVAAEIDRCVVRMHDLASTHPDPPPVLAELKAYPHLLTLAAIVLLDRPLTREEICAIVPYTPASIIDTLVDNNIDEGLLVEDGSLSLTDAGRAAADATVRLQESVVDEAWSDAAAAVTRTNELFERVVAHGRTLDPLIVPPNFVLFAAVCDRPTDEARALRLITAVRYWRSDAHRRALADAGLRSFEGHALNRLWDAHRGVERVGQGNPDPGEDGVASLETRGLASANAITADGIALRERIETETDRLSEPIYATLGEDLRAQALGSLRALPA